MGILGAGAAKQAPATTKPLLVLRQQAVPHFLSGRLAIAQRLGESGRLAKAHRYLPLLASLVASITLLALCLPRRTAMLEGRALLQFGPL